eukprot:COSAG02_NODE_6241_length_3705_cov_183.110094_3_plen_159_part_00
MVTRCPILVQMIMNQSTPSGELHATIKAARQGPPEAIPGDAAIKCPGPRPTAQNLIQWGSQIKVRIGELQDQLVGDGEVTLAKIIVRLEGPCLPNLSLVDLPGLVTDQTMKRKIEALVREKISPKSAIMLVVGQATADPKTWQGAALAKDVDKTEQRT